MSLYRHFLICHVSILEKPHGIQNLALKYNEADNKTKLEADYSKPMKFYNQGTEKISN